MATVQNHTISNFEEYVHLISELRTATGVQLWYRGCGRADYKLIPSIFRHPNVQRNARDFIQIEQRLEMRFKQRSIPFVNRQSLDDWDRLFLMQHYGVPTRLLDWSESPFIALYFAVMSAECRLNAAGRLIFEQPAAIWVLMPERWNQEALSYQSFDRGILNPEDEELKSYKPHGTYDMMNKFPVAIFGAHNSARIVAQRGAFTISGNNTNCMTQHLVDGAFENSVLQKITINKSKLLSMRQEILSYGVTESVVFPDLDGLAKEIKRERGFY